MKRDDSMDRLLRLVDEGTDYVTGSGEQNDDRHFETENTFEQQMLAYARSQAASLGAIAMLLARRDEDFWDEWLRY